MLKTIDHIKYSGQQFSFIDHTDKDIDERIRKGWITFKEFRHQLCSNGISKKNKWRLFEAVSTNTVIYGSCAWTMNNYRRTKLMSDQSKMVREMLGMRWWKAAPVDIDDMREKALKSKHEAAYDPTSRRRTHSAKESLKGRLMCDTSDRL